MNPIAVFPGIESSGDLLTGEKNLRKTGFASLCLLEPTTPWTSWLSILVVFPDCLVLFQLLQNLFIR